MRGPAGGSLNVGCEALETPVQLWIVHNGMQQRQRQCGKAWRLSCERGIIGHKSLKHQHLSVFLMINCYLWFVHTYACLQCPGPFRRENYILSHCGFGDYDWRVKEKTLFFLNSFPNAFVATCMIKNQQLHAHKPLFGYTLWTKSQFLRIAPKETMSSYNAKKTKGKPQRPFVKLESEGPTGTEALWHELP